MDMITYTLNFCFPARNYMVPGLTESRRLLDFENTWGIIKNKFIIDGIFGGENIASCLAGCKTPGRDLNL